MTQRQSRLQAFENRTLFLLGDEAAAYGALYAGCDFFAGYPITPASEIAEVMSRELPRVDGYYVQMEDELGSLSAVIGAVWAGAKGMSQLDVSDGQSENWEEPDFLRRRPEIVRFKENGWQEPCESRGSRMDL